MLYDEKSDKRLQMPSADMGSTILSLRPQPQRESTASQENGHEAELKNQFKIRLANMHGIRHEACMLVQERYIQRGYGPQDLADDPRRLTIVAYEGQEAVGTLSIRFDSSAGLLCDDLYQAEIDVLRAEDRKLCEFVKFAAMSQNAPIKTLAALFHVAFIYAHRIHAFDDVLIEVNPRHVKFYQRALGFRQLGAERTNRRVNAPAVLMRGEFLHIGEQIGKFGGNIEARKEEKSIYPYGFSQHEERGIQLRLQALGAVRQ